MDDFPGALKSTHHVIDAVFGESLLEALIIRGEN